MSREQFISFIESRGFALSNLPGAPYLKYTINIWVYPGHWDMIADEENLEVQYISLQYPKSKADAIEFFRILGIEYYD